MPVWVLSSRHTSSWSLTMIFRSRSMRRSVQSDWPFGFFICSLYDFENTVFVHAIESLPSRVGSQTRDVAYRWPSVAERM